FLSRLTLKLGKVCPLLLSCTVRGDNAVMAVDATNPDSWRDGEIVITRGTLHVFRSKILWEKTCHERLRIHNYGRAAVDVSFAIEFDADFADIFELRGMNRERRGRRLETEVTKDGLVLAYEGLDNRFRRSPHDANGNALWPVSLRWCSVVQHGIRPGRNYHRAPVSVV